MAIPFESTKDTSGSGGGGKPNWHLTLHADQLTLHTRGNPATSDSVTVSSNIFPVLLFDAATTEAAGFHATLPADLATSGTVTYTVAFKCQSIEVGKNAGWRVQSLSLANQENLSLSEVNIESDPHSLFASTSRIEVLSWTSDISTLGWTAGDYISFRVSRNVSVTNDAENDLALIAVSVSAPRE